MTTQPLVAAAVQWAPSADAARNRGEVRRLVGAAAADGARLVVLPEYSQCFAEPVVETAARVAEPLDGPFVAALTAAAGELDVHVVAGMIERDGSDVFNTLIAAGPDGVLARYRKVHLYDAFGGRESEAFASGDPWQAPVWQCDGHGVGMQTCYDVRFPEVTRRLVDAGADVVLVPAQWVPGPLKRRQWATLLAARAIENTVHVVAANHAPPRGTGDSAILDPAGVELGAAGERSETVVVGTLDPARTAAVRESNPCLELRRFRVEPGRPARAD